MLYKNALLNKDPVRGSGDLSGRASGASGTTRASGVSLARAARIVCIGLCIALFSLSACAPRQSVSLKNLSCIHEPEFGGFYFSSGLDEFTEACFDCGDSVDVTFSNMHVLQDVPIYNGYYTKVGEPQLVANTKYSSMKLIINSGADLWETFNINEKTTATVSLREKGKYLDVQNASGLDYSDEREDYESDAVFANFRESAVGRMKPGTVYRSASPCDGKHNRATYTDALMEAAGIRYVVDLADTEEKLFWYLQNPSFNSPYWLSLYDEGLVLPAELTMDFTHKSFKENLVSALLEMSYEEGPYLIHCTEGKDRTGCALALLEMLSGASFKEIEADYMLSFANYYGITKESDPEKYRQIMELLFLPVLESITGPIGTPNAANAGMSLSFGFIRDMPDEAGEKLEALAALTPAQLEACADRYMLQNGADAEQLVWLKECLTGSGD